MNSKKDLNDKFISFFDNMEDNGFVSDKEVTHLNSRVLIIDGL